REAVEATTTAVDEYARGMRAAGPAVRNLLADWAGLGQRRAGLAELRLELNDALTERDRLDVRVRLAAEAVRTLGLLTERQAEAQRQVDALTDRVAEAGRDAPAPDLASRGTDPIEPD